MPEKTPNEIEKLSVLRARGLLSDEEFEREKQRFFAAPPKSEPKSRWNWWLIGAIAGIISLGIVVTLGFDVGT